MVGRFHSIRNVAHLFAGSKCRCLVFLCGNIPLHSIACLQISAKSWRSASDNLLYSANPGQYSAAAAFVLLIHRGCLADRPPLGGIGTAGLQSGNALSAHLLRHPFA